LKLTPHNKLESAHKTVPENFSFTMGQKREFSGQKAIINFNKQATFANHTVSNFSTKSLQAK